MARHAVDQFENNRNTSFAQLADICDRTPELLVAAIEACPINITIADCSKPEMPLAYVNPAFTQTTGYRAEEVLGRNCRFLQGPETDPAHIRTLKNALHTQTSVTVEITNYKKDGTKFLNFLKMAPVHDAHGRLISFIGIQNDITEEREREKTELARQRLEALGELTGGLAHQLNNLLQPILSLVNLHKPDLTDPLIAQDFELILESATQASDLVHDALAFARRNPTVLSPHPLVDTVRAQLDFIRSMLPPDVKLSVKAGPETDSLDVHIDRTLFSQALTNLLINASQAMNGAGHIEIEIVPGPNDNVFLYVKDTGPGIPSENAGDIFAPFFSTKLSTGGTGLGLSVVLRIFYQLNGNISLVDNHQLHRLSIGGGTVGCCFQIELPVKGNENNKT